MLYEITAVGTYFAQTVINRWNYNSAGTPATVSGAFALADAFGAIPAPVTDVLPVDKALGYMMQALSTALSLTNVMVKALYDPVDFYEVPYVTPKSGGNAGQGMSPTAAYGFRTNIVRTDIDRGRKLLAGVVESAVGAGGVLDSGTVSALSNVASFWSDILTYDDEGNTMTFSPCVLAKQQYTTPSGKRAYKKYATLAAQLEHTAIGVNWQPVLTQRTCRSRQYGHGS